MNYLHEIGNNPEKAKAIREYLLSVVHKNAGDDALLGKDTNGYVLAKNAILTAIKQLEEEYGEKKEQVYKPRI